MSKNVKLDFYEAMEIADFITKVDNPNSDEDISETALIDKADFVTNFSFGQKVVFRFKLFCL